MKDIIINNKKVSKISLGTVQLGLNYGIANNEGKPSLEKSFGILDKALSGGITAIDTARGYGNSEEVIGKYLKQTKHNVPFITTKYKCSVDENADYNAVEKDVFNSVETSLNMLGVEKIDCLLLHNAFYKGVYQGKNISKAFEKLIAKGIVGITGLSMARFTEEIDDMLNYDVFTATQVPMNVFDIRLIKNGLYEKMLNKRIKIFVRSVFFQGLFFLKPEKIENEGLKKLVAENIYQLQEIARTEKMSIAQLAISFIRDLDGVASLVLGADNENQVMENLSYINSPSISIESRNRLHKIAENIKIIEIMQELAKPKNK